MFLLNPIIGMLHNQALNRWHPILFYEAPFPGPAESGKPVRMRSKGHHTEGYATREAAVAGANELAEKVAGARLAIEQDIEWAGDGVPALNLLCAESDGKVVLVG